MKNLYFFTFYCTVNAVQNWFQASVVQFVQFKALSGIRWTAVKMREVLKFPLPSCCNRIDYKITNRHLWFIQIDEVCTMSDAASTIDEDIYMSCGSEQVSILTFLLFRYFFFFLLSYINKLLLARKINCKIFAIK